jgi:hypothetical protein
MLNPATRTFDISNLTLVKCCRFNVRRACAVALRLPSRHAFFAPAQRALLDVDQAQRRTG